MTARDRKSGRPPGRPPSAIVRAIFLTLLSPLLLCILLLALPGAGVHALVTRLRQRRFRRRWAGQQFFVWHARGNWHDFVRNNVLPALPPAVRVLQERRPPALRPQKRALLRELRRVLPQRYGAAPGRPWLFTVQRTGVTLVSLNEVLQAAKMRARRDPAVQAEVRALLDDALRGRARRT